MKLKNLFAITAIASALVLTGCKEEKKADAASTAPCLLYTSDAADE